MASGMELFNALRQTGADIGEAFMAGPRAKLKGLEFERAKKREAAGDLREEAKFAEEERQKKVRGIVAERLRAGQSIDSPELQGDILDSGGTYSDLAKLRGIDRKRKSDLRKTPTESKEARYRKLTLFAEKLANAAHQQIGGAYEQIAAKMAGMGTSKGDLEKQQQEGKISPEGAELLDEMEKVNVRFKADKEVLENIVAEIKSSRFPEYALGPQRDLDNILATINPDKFDMLTDAVSGLLKELGGESARIETMRENMNTKFSKYADTTKIPSLGDIQNMTVAAIMGPMTADQVANMWELKPKKLKELVTAKDVPDEVKVLAQEILAREMAMGILSKELSEAKSLENPRARQEGEEIRSKSMRPSMRGTGIRY